MMGATMSGSIRLILAGALLLAAAGLGGAQARDAPGPRLLPRVFYGPPVDQYPPADSAPAPATEAPPPAASGGTCESVLLLAHVTRYCALASPLPLGAWCECPFPPPPPGLLPSPPSPGRVIP
jgi:hypothetical protein